ncbi:hypothetical protein [Oryza sativa Japonica Group]|uniref:Uncharacterized protein n=1 Tax=Oryza sativa subsp. japonica TaxID=39947 RepID=Q5QNI6_ORYSJ|nr:hypothetical protein [Oryza sativa Japonica Group]
MTSRSNVFGANDTSADILVPLSGGGNDTNTEDLFETTTHGAEETLLLADLEWESRNGLRLIHEYSAVVRDYPLMLTVSIGIELFDSMRFL